MPKSTRGKDCGNSPKNKLAEEIAIALVTFDYDFLQPMLVDDFVFHQSAEEPLNVDQAELWLDDAIEVDLIAARKKAVNDPTKVQFNSPPAVTHRVAIGLHKASRYITIKTVATAMFSEEIKTQVGEVGYSEHTVVSGDNLYALSRQYYENSSGWDRIFQANRDILDNANDLSIGQVLRIPTG